MSIEIYVEAAMVRKQRGRLVGSVAYIALVLMDVLMMKIGILLTMSLTRLI